MTTDPTPGDAGYAEWIRSLSSDEFADYLRRAGTHSTDRIDRDALKHLPHTLNDGDAVAFLPTPGTSDSNRHDDA